MNVNKININQSEQTYYIASQVYEVNAAKEDALQAIAENEQSAITNFNSQRVTPEMLSESTKQLIESSGGGTITNLADDEDITSVDDGTGSDNLVNSGGVIDALNDITNNIYGNSILRAVEITDGGFVDPGNGQVVKDVAYCYTDYIAIKPNTDYGPIIFCAWYNENKVYISGVLDANADTYTSPSNAKYARVSISLYKKESWDIAEDGVIADGWQKKIFTKNLIKKNNSNRRSLYRTQ